MTTTDTPKDACHHCGADDCKPYYRPHGQECRSALCEMTERAKQAEAEVERLKAELDSLQRLRPTRDDARKLEAEVESLQAALDQMTRDAVKLKAEAERMKKRPFGCKCENFREKVLGDGCDECNKALAIELLTEERDELEAEVDRLRANLRRAIEIADKCLDCLIPVFRGEHEELEAEIKQLKESIK